MKQYIVDAFTDKVFSGNPAAVCVMDRWPSEELMQSIAVENCFAETAFTVKEKGGYRLRWFTPGGEIDLCGHATLAAGYVILRFYETQDSAVSFETMSGPLTVCRDGDRLEMDFPAYEARPVPVTDTMARAIGTRPAEAYIDRDLMLVVEDQSIVAALTPDQEKLMELPGLLCIVTAKGMDFDCVSRVFGPKLAVPEDPVTGSAHCMLAPYWAVRLGKTSLTCFQASRRTGVLSCSLAGRRVKLAGQAVLFAVSEILPEL